MNLSHFFISFISFCFFSVIFRFCVSLIRLSSLTSLHFKFPIFLPVLQLWISSKHSRWTVVQSTLLSIAGLRKVCVYSLSFLFWQCSFRVSSLFCFLLYRFRLYHLVCAGSLWYHIWDEWRLSCRQTHQYAPFVWAVSSCSMVSFQSHCCLHRWIDCSASSGSPTFCQSRIHRWKCWRCWFGHLCQGVAPCRRLSLRSYTPYYLRSAICKLRLLLAISIIPFIFFIRFHLSLYFSF